MLARLKRSGSPVIRTHREVGQRTGALGILAKVRRRSPHIHWGTIGADGKSLYLVLHYFCTSRCMK